MNRVTWAMNYRDTDWKRCIFVDECCVSSEKDGIRTVKRPRGERYNPKFVNNSDHCRRQVVSVWASITYYGLGPIVFLDSRLDSSTYHEII